MELYSSNDNYKLYKGDMRNMLDVIKKESIDAVLTDPPYELNFMGKGWDNSGIAFQPSTWKKCYEVLKPGGYLLAFGGSRTFHRIACAIEDAGFEIRDTIMWLYGSGFPKSHNIGLDIDKLNGCPDRGHRIATASRYHPDGTFEPNGEQLEPYQTKTEEAHKWNGWGTALKPSYEPIIVARKPIEGTVAKNCLKYGVGGINIDECRVETKEDLSNVKPIGTMPSNKVNGKGFERPWMKDKNKIIEKQEKAIEKLKELGRFPANTILTYDETDFDEVCGGFPNTKSTYNKDSKHETEIHRENADTLKYGYKTRMDSSSYNDSGSASRYFMNCKYTGKDEEIWKQLFVNNVGNNLEILKATKDNIVQMNVEDLLKELKNHYAKYVESQQDLIETPIVQDIVKMLTWDFKIETSQVIQDFIINSKKCIQFLNLVQFVEKMDNIDTTQTTQNLLKLFGYVKVVITNYILGNIEYDQKRYIYIPKASKKDRDEGLDEFEIKTKVFDGKSNESSKEMKDVEERFTTLGKNTHPTVKPTALMQYLVRLVTPNEGTILDPFNGSGSTGKAVMYENKERNKNYKYIGIELTEEYLPIAKARIEYACKFKLQDVKNEEIATNIKQDADMQDNQMSIFDIIGGIND